MRSIGIDIGSSSIKIAEVNSSSQGFVLVDYAEFPLNPDPAHDSRVDIVDYLRKISGHYGQDNIRYVFAMPQEKVAVRPISFPFKERHNILKSLSSQLEDDIPFDQDDAIFDAKILRTHGSSAEVLAMACPNKYVEEVLQLAFDAGIDPDIVTVDVPATANLFEAWLNPPRDIPGPLAAKENLELAQMSEDTAANIEINSGCQVVACIGHKRTLLSVYYRQTLLATRTLSRGGHDIVEGLRRAYSLPYVEALKGLQEKGFILTTNEGASQDQVDFSNIIVSALKPIADEIKLTLLELKSAYGTIFSQIYLTGGVSRLMNIAPYLTKELELPCNLLRHIERVPKVSIQVTPSLESSSLSAIGIAVEGLKKPRNPALNLRKQEFGKQSQSFKYFLEKWGTTLRYAGLILALAWIYTFIRDESASRLDTASRAKFQDTVKTAFNFKGRDAGESKVRSFIKEKRNEISARKDLAELQYVNSALDVINDLSEKMPDKPQLVVDVRRVLIKNENLTIEGEVSTRDQVGVVRTALIGLSTDRQVKDMTPSIRPSQGKFAFAFSVKTPRR